MSGALRSALTLAVLALLVVVASIWGWAAFTEPFPQDEPVPICENATITAGSEKDPLPIGQWKVKGIAKDPTFHYNPDLFWDADADHAKAKIPPGPNNPVGVVWIDLDKEHYGLHGTPEPSRVGHAESHGCVRLTNWDTLRLAAMVGKGTMVEFVE